jgi:proline iminopeptidase
MKNLLAICLAILLSGVTMADTDAPSPLASGEHEVMLNGVQLHYTVGGSGPVIVAHSGGPGIDARTWGDLAGIDDFATVVVLHPRGSGLSHDAPDGAYRLADYAADLEALRLHLGLDELGLLGWSHGGMVAMQYAATFPQAVSRLILFSTSAYFADFLEDTEAAVQKFRDEPWFEDAYAALQDEWAGNYESDEEMTQLLLRELKFYFHDFDENAAAYLDSIRPYGVRIASLQAFNADEAPRMDLRPLLPDITAPTLVLAGRSDFITNVAMAEEMVRHIPQADLVVFEQSGHFAVVEEPERFHDSIRAFVIE